MIEPKLTLFKMQIKSRFRKPSKLGQTHFSDAPEVFDAVNMGLTICKKVVEGHNGELDVESQMNVGSTFTIRLPKSS
jgi:light-regulated signal transduction histidine kinase (bacteriophytochrome)